MSVRRRGLIGTHQHEVIPPLEYPDAYMAIFKTTADGSSKPISYGGYVNRYILDGVEYTLSTPVYTITIPTAGTHVLYFWFVSSARLTNNFSADYFRIPENPSTWHLAFFYTSTIGQLDCLSKTPYSAGAVFGQGCTIGKIRVPVGSGDTYKAADGWKKFKSVIEETNDFTYNPL